MASSEEVDRVVSNVAARLISRFDEHRIERTLAPLVGKRLRAATRAGTIHIFTFGEERKVPVRFPRPGGPTERVVAEYALHVQCAWQMSVAHAVHVGNAVVRIKGDNDGGLRLDLADDLSLELNPGAREGEYWRFLRPGTNERHFVVSDAGIYLD
jgi:hypothetical protein